jgi:hypothetical protein
MIINNFKILSIFLGTIFLTAGSQKSTSNLKKDLEYITYNRTIEQVTENGKSVVRLSEGTGAGMAWVKDTEFTEGTIEFDAKGRDVLQKSFIGIAFHGKDNETYETVYFRPFNFQSADPARKIHAVQYAFEPNYGFQQLRDTRKDEFESAIKPSTIQATDWFHVKVEVRANKIKVFINGVKEPCLEVATLNPNATGKKIGYWVGNNSNGDFANFKTSTDR